MLLLNAYVIPGRGQALNFSVEFKGGSEIVARFAKNIEAGQIRQALEELRLPRRGRLQVLRHHRSGLQRLHDPDGGGYAPQRSAARKGRGGAAGQEDRGRYPGALRALGGG